MHNIVIGTGPAAAGAILALAADPAQRITVVDIGERLRPDRALALTRMSTTAPDDWSPSDVSLTGAQPQRMAGSAVPEKRAYGSNHMFADIGQQTGLVMPDHGNHAVVSGAFGGFSTVWGAQIMPFARSTFSRWPLGWEDIEPHYRAILAVVPLAADCDDLAEDFPLLDARAPLPPVSARTAAVLERYHTHRDAIRARGVVIGKGRLAFEAEGCVRCGMCMTGCPYSLIYSASRTFDNLIDERRIEYIPSALVTRVEEATAGRPSVHGIHLKSGSAFRVEADRVFVGAGGLGSTRIALNSMRNPPSELDLQESMQFLVPFVSRRSTGDPRGQHDFTLNQFNILLKFDDEAYTTAQVHCYPFNPAMAAVLPGWLPDSLSAAVLGRLTVGLGYLPSWCSPRMRVELLSRNGHDLPDIAVRVDSDARPAMLTPVLRRLSRLGPDLDLYPVAPMVRTSGPAKSYHFGSTFGHGSGSDLLGRFGEFRNVHLIDGSVLPSVPSTTFTLTVMANAHRIASEVQRAPAEPW